LYKLQVYDCTRFFPAFFQGFSTPRKQQRTLAAGLREAQRAAHMSLTPKDVEGIAHLARLAISEAQLPEYVDRLSKIFSFVEQLNSAAVAQVEPMAHPLAGQTQRMRPDEIADSDRHDKYQRNAARTEAGLYLVPKVIE
jgi:aspartyl-tRNA(Asn)/glutamyl-tRNA(Gln) amidotransferase subunit C